jgi:hypothetical protein
VPITAAVRKNAKELAEGKLPERPKKSEQRAVKLLSLLKTKEMTVLEMVEALELRETSTGYVIGLIYELRDGGVPLTWRVNANEDNKGVARIWGLKGIKYKNRAVKAKG